MSPSPLLLIGLGNPGEKYARHRHNVGFLFVDAIADAHGFSPPRRKFQAEVREGSLEGPAGRRRAIMIKPATYMNDSGQAAGEASRFYKCALSDIVVFHDELDLAPGKLRAKIGGGNAGHNGLRSLDAHLGADYRRIRIGIGHPGDKSKVTNHVLGDFGKADEEWLVPLLAAATKAAPMLLENDARFLTAVAVDLNSTGNKQRAHAPNHTPAAPTSGAEQAARPIAQALAKLLGPKK